MKILHVVPTYFPAVRYGGPIRSVHGLARALAARGHDVHVYTTNVDGPSVSDVPLGRAVNLDGVSVWYFPTALGRRLYRSPEMGRALWRHVADFDLVHTHSVFLWPTSMAAHVARRNNVPYVLSPRGMLVSDLIRRKSRLLKQAWIAAFERRNFRLAAAVHATAAIEVEDFRRLGLTARRIFVVANGAENPPAELPLAGEPRTVLFLGRINWKKGLDRLIPAMARVGDAQLIIAGDDDEGYRAKMEKLAHDIGLGERVRFLDPVHGADKWKLFAQASVVVLPSYSENFGNVVLEAMSVGRPVVVTPEVGIAEVVRRTGAGIVCSGEVAQLGQALNALLTNPDKAQSMGAAGQRAFAEHFTWDAIAGQMEQEYAGIIAERGVASARKSGK